MDHQFFRSLDSFGEQWSTFVPKVCNVPIQPNAVAKGLHVEANLAGAVVAVQYPNGLSVRNNFRYLISHSPEGNALIDCNQLFHPLD